MRCVASENTRGSLRLPEAAGLRHGALAELAHSPRTANDVMWRCGRYAEATPFDPHLLELSHRMTSFRVALAQVSPVLLDPEATLAKVVASVREAAQQGAQLIEFGEAMLPGYPVWLAATGGARFDDAVQKSFHERYHAAAIDPDRDLDELRSTIQDCGVAVVLGCVERAVDRSGHSLYCTALTIGSNGETLTTHRKLMPTYEERLAWSIGDGHGLRVHDHGAFRVGVLNCWENWMPLARAALHAQGEDLHIAIWPGSRRNTIDLTPHMAREGRSFVVSVSATLRRCDIPEDFPLRDVIAPDDAAWLHDGGSCVCAPDGRFLLEPVVEREGVFVVELDPREVARERQNFDPSGHYSRPDVLRLEVDRRRQRSCRWIDE